MALIASRTSRTSRRRQQQPAIRRGGLLRRYRWTEFGLLILPGLVLLTASSQLWLAVNLDSNTTLNMNSLPLANGMLPMLEFMVAVFVVHIVLTIFFRKADQILLPLVSLLTGLGIIMMTRLGPNIGTPNLGTRQLQWAIVALGVCLATMFVLRNIEWLSRYKYTWMLFCFAVLIPAIINGIKTLHGGDPTRDILDVGFLKIQPSEFLKIGVAIFFAAYLNDNLDMIARGYYRLGFLRLPPLRQLGPLIFILALSLASFLIIRELGLALLIYGLFLCMTYLATNKFSYVFVSLLTFIVLAYVGYLILPYVRARFIAVTFNPLVGTNTLAYNNYVENAGSQVFQGLLNLASGGVIGSGLGLGAPWLTSVIESDMVLTAYGEELGLAGLFAIIAIYLLIIHRGFRIAAQANDTFSKLLAAGLTCVFAIQTLIISAGNLKIMPLTGIPLPFLSNGVNALVANFIIVGILLRISHNTAVENEGLY
ncbi:cell cycle protein [Ktedonobacteria bacterium brp13]|nr:cell cycle protein [Ktedonobacteria bacterium brp13]